MLLLCAGCVREEECATHFVEADGRCIGSATDGGRDSGVRDGGGSDTGPSDTGPVDSGADAGPPLDPVTKVAGGFLHTCALRESGRIQCWGSNMTGQLGDGSMLDRAEPVGVLGVADAIDVHTGFGHTCALRRGGVVLCWGANDLGQLGRSPSEIPMSSSVPVQVVDLADAQSLGGGGTFTCARRSTSQVVCWGENRYGTLGNGMSGMGMFSDRPVTAMGIVDATALSRGPVAEHICAMRVGSTIACWGNNEHGQIDGSGMTQITVPATVPMLDSVAEVAGGTRHTCARRGRTVVCWGDNENFQLGNGSMVSTSTPSPVGMIEDAARLTAGFFQNCARGTSGTVRCWGGNASGQLGDGTMESRSMAVTALGIDNAVDVAAGGEHSCALLDDSRVFCWGSNLNGQLGDGTMDDRLMPTPVLGIP